MSKKVMVVLFVFILLFNCLSFVLAQEDGEDSSETTEVKTPDWLNEEACPENSCSYEEGPPKKVTVSEGANPELPSDYEGEVEMTEGSFQYGDPPEIYSGTGECEIEAGEVSCNFKGEGIYEGIPVEMPPTGGDISLSAATGELIIDCPKTGGSCEVEGVDFVAGTKARYMRMGENNGIIFVEEGKVEPPLDFQGSVELEGLDARAELPDGSILSSGAVDFPPYTEGKSFYDLIGRKGSPAVLTTSEGETVTAFVSTTTYIPLLSNKKCSGVSSCIKFGDNDVFMSGYGIRLDLRDDSNIQEIFFMPGESSTCGLDTGEDCLMVTKGGAVTKANKDGKIFCSPPTCLPGVTTKVCSEKNGDQTCQDYVYSSPIQTGSNSGTCTCSIDPEGPQFCEITYAEATSFFSFIGKAWAWITGKVAGTPTIAPVTCDNVNGGVGLLNDDLCDGCVRQVPGSDPPSYMIMVGSCPFYALEGGECPGREEVAAHPVWGRITLDGKIMPCEGGKPDCPLLGFIEPIKYELEPGVLVTQTVSARMYFIHPDGYIAQFDAGSWSEKIIMRSPDGRNVIISTDDFPAGVNLFQLQEENRDLLYAYLGITHKAPDQLALVEIYSNKVIEAPAQETIPEEEQIPELEFEEQDENMLDQIASKTTRRIHCDQAKKEGGVHFLCNRGGILSTGAREGFRISAFYTYDYRRLPDGTVEMTISAYSNSGVAKAYGTKKISCGKEPIKPKCYPRICTDAEQRPNYCPPLPK